MDAEITISATPYGDVPFFVTLAADATVSGWRSPLLDQLDALLKLNFGTEWETVKHYVRRLGELLTVQIPVLLKRDERPARMGEVWAKFHAAYPTPPPADPDTEARAGFWHANFAFFPYFAATDPQLNATRQRLFELTNRKRKLITRRPEAERAAVLPHLALLAETLPAEALGAVLRLIGALNLPAADDYLFTTFNAPRSPVDTPEFLRAIEESDYARNAPRLRSLYQRGRFDAETLALYLRVLNRKRDPENVPLALRILAELPYLAEDVYPVLRRNDYRERYGVLREVLRNSRENRLTDDVFGLLRSVAPPTERPTLADLYAQKSDPQLTSMAPVTWSQSIFKNHAAASSETDAAELARLIQDALTSPARLQNLALLELYRAETEGRDLLAARPELQARVLNAVASRVDKVSASALRVVSRCYPAFTDPAAVIRAIVPLTVRARYQTQLYKILKGRAEDSTALAVQAEAFKGLIQTITTPEEIQAVRQILGYLTEVPGQQDLLRQLERAITLD